MNHFNTLVKAGRDYAAWLIFLAVAAIVAFALFGMPGFRAVAGIMALFALPVLLLLKNTGLDAEEKVFFSLFVGISLFPLAAWLVNRAVPSFRLSAVLALAGFAAVGFFAPRISARLRKPQ